MKDLRLPSEVPHVSQRPPSDQNLSSDCYSSAILPQTLKEAFRGTQDAYGKGGTADRGRGCHGLMRKPDGASQIHTRKDSVREEHRVQFSKAQARAGFLRVCRKRHTAHEGRPYQCH